MILVLFILDLLHREERHSHADSSKFFAKFLKETESMVLLVHTSFISVVPPSPFPCLLLSFSTSSRLNFSLLSHFSLLHHILLRHLSILIAPRCLASLPDGPCVNRIKWVEHRPWKPTPTLKSSLYHNPQPQPTAHNYPKLLLLLPLLLLLLHV
jgi:hypothetical protein